MMNVRGLNSAQKQKEVQNLFLTQQAGIVCLIETKLKSASFDMVYANLFQQWCVTSNFHTHKGGRILVAWVEQNFGVNIVHVSDQIIHVEGYNKVYKKAFQLSVVYGHNDNASRLAMWRDLERIGANMVMPWIVVGDFNSPLHYDDRVGSTVSYAEIRDFQQMVNKCNLVDLACTGPRYTWNNKQLGSSRVLSKIDRSLINDVWIENWPNSIVHFLPEGWFDHSPMVIRFDKQCGKGRASFKFFDMWTSHPEYLDTVKQAWNIEVTGVPMFKVVRKLKSCKYHLKNLNKQHYDKIADKHARARGDLEDIQQLLHRWPADPIVASYERYVAEQFKEANKAYGSYLAQKAKVKWLKEGDENTSFFHKIIKVRQHQQKILQVNAMDGTVRSTPDEVVDAFQQFYVQLLGSTSTERQHIQPDIIKMGPTVNDEQANLLLQAFSDDEIKGAMFSIPNFKAPGPDGFNSTFFKTAWGEIGGEVCTAIRDFFSSGKMLKELNCTKITLIPKVSHPTSVTEFRPIACCNTLYKCITKLICMRLKRVLPQIISPNQSGFIEGRQIVHNVSILQDLVGVYNRKSAPPGCLLKVDIRKAYDSVHWEFLKEMLKELNFPNRFIDWIMACVTTPSYSLCINGSTKGFFHGKQGLRQGDPMSPLLFVICMEYLSRLLQYASYQQGYQFHYRCKGVRLNHLVFADDLILFSRGDEFSIMQNMRALATFAKVSGLAANSGKSALYVCNVPDEIKSSILDKTGFMEDKLPFRYLGVKISAKKLSKADCEFMADKIGARIRSWGSRTLSYAGRAQLVNSVLLNLHTYWASMFIIPKKVIDMVIASCRSYLWAGQVGSSKALLAWDWVCRPKNEGGLGFKESHAWNLALLGKYVWSIAKKEDNMWVRWINHVYLKQQTWMSYCPPANASWYWKTLCKVKDHFRSGYYQDRWVFNPRGYSAKTGYQWLRGERPKVEWACWVWSRFNIPKTRFICWLIMWNRLQTKDKLHRFGVIDNDTCPLCNQEVESIDHVYFRCNYSQMCLTELCNQLGIRRSLTQLPDMDQWLRRPAEGRFKAGVIRACFTALMYQIWIQRNEVVWKKKLGRPEALIRFIKWQCYWRIMQIQPRKISVNNQRWFDKSFRDLSN